MTSAADVGASRAMKPAIYIHIGMHKTGTTSIQATFYANRRRLLRHDINYFGIAENHSQTLFPLFCDRPHAYIKNRRSGIDTEAKAARKNAATAYTLRRSLEKNRCSRFVISGEALSALSPAGVARLKATLAPYAAQMRIVAYLREPYGYMTSAVQQRLRDGETYEDLIAKPPLPNYRKRLSGYFESFGREQIEIRVFDPEHFAGADLIADFLTAIDAPAALARELPALRRNVALSLEAAWLMNAANKRYRRHSAAAPNPALFADLPELLAAIPGQRFALPPKVYAAAAPVIDEDLAWLHRQLGQTLFTRATPTERAAPRWNEETVAALAVLINDLAHRTAGWGHRWQDAGAFIAGLAPRFRNPYGGRAD